MSESVKIDLRLDPGLKEKLEAIAVDHFEARIHHISKRPELTTTINRLIKLGIKALEDGYPDKSANYPDNVITSETMSQAIAAALAPLSEDLENLKKQISDLLSSPPPFPLETKPVEMVGPMETIEHMESLEAVEAIAHVEQTELTIEPMETDFSKGLTGKELAKRLRVSPSGLSRAWKAEPDSEPRPEHFREWSKEKDRDGCAWEKKGDKFFPVSD